MAAKKTKRAPRPKHLAIAMDKQWQTESDMRTLMEAEKIKADKGRLSAAQSYAKKQAALAARIGKS